MIKDKLELPCGAVLQNRVAKAAMTERLAGPSHIPNDKLIALYKHWGREGAGLLITGNMMLDRRYLESGGNLVLESATPIAAFREMAAAAIAEGSHAWVQLNHPGRQASIFSTLKPLSASNVKLKKLGLFAKPRPMTEIEIIDLVNRYRTATLKVIESGFTGIQIHAAHGYLLSQFLSPLTNLREDSWGGDIKGRSRLLFKIVEEVRKEAGDDFPISVKINSADFQRGGFSEEDSLYVISGLNERKIDLIEISGGTYEQLAFFIPEKESTRQREAYFLEFTRKARIICELPIMLTGGFSTLEFCEKVLNEGEVDIIGMARPFLLYSPFLPAFLEGGLPALERVSNKMPVRSLTDMAEAGWYDYQIERFSRGLKPDLEYSSWKAVLRLTINEISKGLQGKVKGL